MNWWWKPIPPWFDFSGRRFQTSMKAGIALLIDSRSNARDLRTPSGSQLSTMSSAESDFWIAIRLGLTSKVERLDERNSHRVMTDKNSNAGAIIRSGLTPRRSDFITNYWWKRSKFSAIIAAQAGASRRLRTGPNLRPITLAPRDQSSVQSKLQPITTRLSNRIVGIASTGTGGGPVGFDSDDGPHFVIKQCQEVQTIFVAHHPAACHKHKSLLKIRTMLFLEPDQTQGNIFHPHHRCRCSRNSQQWLSTRYKFKVLHSKVPHNKVPYSKTLPLSQQVHRPKNICQTQGS